MRIVSWLAAIMFVSLHSAVGDNTGWRGNGTGNFPRAAPATSWSRNQNVVWKTSLPDWSNASPILVDDRLFICSEPTTLICLSAATGKILWQRTNAYADVLPEKTGDRLPKVHKITGYSSPTPVSDGKHVYVFFATGTLVCYDFRGYVQWARYVKPHPPSDWGYSASPVLAGNRLIVHTDSIIAFDCRTGRELWSVRANAKKWGSLIGVRIGGQDAVVSSSGDVVAAKDGRRLCAAFSGLTYNTPIAVGDLIYFIQHGGKAFRVRSGRGDELWTTTPRSDRYYSSPVCSDGLLYAVNKVGHFSVIDARDGLVVHEKALKLGGTAYPSVVVAGRHVFVSSDNGTTAVLTLGRNPREISRNKLEPFRSSPLFHENRIYIRTLKTMYCIAGR